MAYGNEIKQKALRLYMDRWNIAAISELDEMPTERTIHYWRKQGVCTDGEEWGEYRDRTEEREALQKQNVKLAKKQDELDTFYERAIPELQEAFWEILDGIKSGQVRIKAGDVKTILSSIRRLENRGAELRRFQHEFMTMVFSAAREMMSQNDFDLFVEKVKHIQSKQLTEMNPDSGF